MKRPRIYMPRTGIRFARSDAGPPGGFIGGDVQVLTVSGSVNTIVCDPDRTFKLPSIPFMGYPVTNDEMRAAVGGGVWEAGYLFNESTGSLVDSFGSGYLLTGSRNRVAYQQEGFRGLFDGDYAAQFPGDNSPAFTAGEFRAVDNITLTPVVGEDLIFAFIAKFKTTAGAFDVIAGNGVRGLEFRGWQIAGASFSANSSYVTLLTIGGVGPAVGDLAEVIVTNGNWFACVGAMDRASGKAAIATKDLTTGVVSFHCVDGGDSTAWILSSSMPFTIGGEPDSAVYYEPKEFALSAFYIGAQSGSAFGMASSGSIVSMVNGFANVVSAPNEYLFSGSDVVESSLSSFGTYKETKLINSVLLGSGTGSLGYSHRSPTRPTTGSLIPSWANKHLGSNASFVVQTLSSSNHEVTSLNLYRSGSEPLELSAVPASASLYYSKKSSLNKITVKKTASYFDTTPDSPGVYVPDTFAPTLGSKINTVQGGGFGAGAAGTASERITPATIFLNVPVKGKLVDIKVWLELHHTSGSAGGFPLGCLGVALRSPNLQWGMSHPLLNRNDPTVAETFLGQPQNFWTDSFILWEGLGVSAFDQRSYVADGEHLPNSIFREKFAGWDRDLDMRTIFSDGAEVNNPRHNLGYHASGNYVGSPNASLGINSAWGMAISWTGSQGSPPAGWLTGLGGVTSSFNEWPTTGSNAGANFIKPLYPLLDPIQVSIAQQSPGVTYPEQFFGQKVSPEKIIGTRPGLRGTEISGSWQLLFTYSADDDNTADPPDIYFRQARLEITYEEHEGTSYRRGNSTSTPVRPGPKQVWEISGTLLSSVVTASNYVSVLFTNESSVGRTFGIALNTGTINFSDSALVYRLTGSLADTSGSAPGWLLNNRFSMPMIPISSASLAAAEESVNISINPQQIVTTRPLLDGPRRLRDAANDAQPQKTRARYAAELISGSLT